jgi:starch synthase
MNILFAASELTPYARTGGLGDVLSALPAALRGRGHSVSVVLPLYRTLRENLKNLKRTEIRLAVPVGETVYLAPVWEGRTDLGVVVFAVERDEFFDRSHLYGNDLGDYLDNAARFVFFSRAVAELARHINPLPEILHLNDWQTGLVPAFVRHLHLPCATVFTIHNLAYQGSFPGYDFPLTRLPSEYFTPETTEFHGRLNFLKAGLHLADHLTTVSPTYAREITEAAHGCGLDGLLSYRGSQLTGILNGIDTRLWNPSDDPALASPFTAAKLAGKEKCKQALLKTFGFEKGAKRPLFACISRLVEQKGFPLLFSLVEELAAAKARLVILGSGDPSYEQRFKALSKAHPDTLKVKIGFNDKLAHQIEAGADFFLMPSQFEPCGLNQMYSQRYGTIPVVHATGGLEDSVEDWDEGTQTGNGLKFHGHTPEGLRGAVQRALELYAQKAALRKIRQNAMATRHGWENRLDAYEEVYRRALASAV